MSYTYLQGQGEESSAASFSDMPASVLSRLNLTVENPSCKGSETESCPSSQSGMMFALSTENHGADSLMPSAGAFPAREFHQPETEPDLTTKKAVFGASKLESLATFDPESCSLKTHQCSLLEAGCESLRTLPRWGMIVAGELYPLLTPSGLLELRASITSESASGYTGCLPTVTAFDANCGDLNGKEYDGETKHAMKLIQAINRLPTPTVNGNNNRKGISPKAGDGLRTAVIRLSTPLANDGASAKRGENSKLRGTPPLREQIQRLPTPNASDNRDRGNLSNPSVQRRLKIGKQISLSATVTD